MIKSIFFTFLLVSIFISCSSEQANESTSESMPIDESLAPLEEEIDIYEKDWQTLKTAIVNKNEAVVLTFVSNDDPVLKEAMDISYEYIFDDEVIEKIKDLNFKDLDQLGIDDIESEEEILNWEIRFINLKKQLTSDSINSQVESTIEIELLKTENGLKITNYKTFQK